MWLETLFLLFLWKSDTMIKRIIEDKILADFRRKKVIVLLGARQVGKTTLLSAIEGGFRKILSLNCDNVDDVLELEGKTSTELNHLLSPYDLVLIDEAQRVRNIGLVLKIIGDLKLDTQVIVTGSSSLDMANEINEPADAKRTLMSLTNNYLYKDLFTYKGIKKPDLIQKLVRALALQLGSEVSYNELSNLLGVDRSTVESYINLLEKCFVVFRLDSFSRNIRNEIKKGKKFYFYYNGIRNAVI